MERWSEAQMAALKNYLDEKAYLYETLDFLELDPIQIPHSYQRKEDIEISGFLIAILSWGQRKTIINKGKELMQRMDNEPFHFVLSASEIELKQLSGFVHRTFQSDDARAFVLSLRKIYQAEGLENRLAGLITKHGMQMGLSEFKTSFFEATSLSRTHKHLPEPMKGSAGKRLNMYLRWMVRPGEREVDFGIWKTISPGQLYIPLDVHTSNVGRQLGLLQRKQNDWQAVEEMTKNLRLLDSQDPVKYDFALFGIGAYRDEIPTKYQKI